MTDAALRLVDGAEEPEAGPEAAEPKVFARSISVPPGAPWDQARAAKLEARVGTPLPIGEVTYQLRRLHPWQPGRAAKFAAFYVRAKDVGQRLQATVLVDERWMEVVFVSRGQQQVRARRLGLISAGVGGGLVIALASIAVAISARGTAESELEDLEQLAATKSHLADAVQQERREARALEAANVKGRGLSDYLTDLDWAAAAKAPDARVQAIHWDRGAMAVEARGDRAPFGAAGRQVTRMDKPVRPGVWLWGVTQGAPEALVPDGGPRPDPVGGP